MIKKILEMVKLVDQWVADGTKREKKITARYFEPKRRPKF